MPEQNDITFNIDYNLECIDTVREDLLSFLAKNTVDPEICWVIELSTYEALVNIVEHSPSEKSGEKIIFRCTIKKNGIEMIIENAGIKFDATKAKLPDINSHFEKGKKGGLGVYIFRKLMDKVEYKYKDGRNILKMTKRLQ